MFRDGRLCELAGGEDAPDQVREHGADELHDDERRCRGRLDSGKGIRQGAGDRDGRVGSFTRSERAVSRHLDVYDHTEIRCGRLARRALTGTRDRSSNGTRTDERLTKGAGMPTIRMIPEDEATGVVRDNYEEIKRTLEIDFVSTVTR